MRSISTNLSNELKEGNICNLVKITLKNGTIHAYTDLDQNITVDGQLYVYAAGLQKVKMTLTNNSEVSNQELASAWVDAPEEDLTSGLFDSAKIQVSWCSWKHPEYGQFNVFTGNLGEITWTEDGFKADIFSHMKALESNIGDVFTGNCRHTLFSTATPGKIGACNASSSGFTGSGSVTSIIRNRWKFNTSVSAADGYYSNGKITFTSGQNNGLSFVIKTQTAGVIELFLPTSFIIAPGDSFSIVAGCDKTSSTCLNKFNNIVNFGGFPHIQSDINFR